ncbi:hypothetical protein Tco_0983149 [Tanacetum coccineum]
MYSWLYPLFGKKLEVLVISGNKFDGNLSDFLNTLSTSATTRLVAGDAFPGRHVARNKLSGKARRGYVPERLTRATTPGPRGFSQAIKCRREGFSRATCRPG